MSTETSAVFSVNKDILDVESSDNAAVQQRIEKNIKSQLWEALKLADPYKHEFDIYFDGKVVHESNRDTGKDIREVIHRGWRRGTERKAAYNYVPAIHQAKLGQRVVWVSPADEGWEGVGYIDHQINVATIVSEATPTKKGLAKAEQYQIPKETTKMTTSQLQLLVEQITDKKTLSPESLVDDVITYVAVTDKLINKDVIQNEQDRVLGYRVEQAEDPYFFERISRLEINARRYIEAINLGMRDQELNIFYAKLLGEIFRQSMKPESLSFSGSARVGGGFGFQTSCGFIGISGSQSKTSSKESGEMIKCRSCGFENTCNKHNCAFCKGSLASLNTLNILILV